MESMPLTPAMDDLPQNRNGSKISNVHHKRRWSVWFWLILKLLGLYFHRSVVSSRECYVCKVKRRIKRERVGNTAGAGRSDGPFKDVDYLFLAYEQPDRFLEESDAGNDPDESRDGGGEEEGERCAICDFLWWNGNGCVDIYDETVIGVSRWNHRGSNLLSTILLLIGIAALLYDIAVLFVALLGDPNQMLRLMIKTTLAIILLIPPVVCICSKFRSYLYTGVVSNFSWTTALNVRYLIVRAQFLNPASGIPGKRFLIILVTVPLLLAFHRAVMFIYVINCPTTSFVVLTSALGLIFAEYWGLLLYVIYTLRISFQRQLTLVIMYIKEHEGNVKECNGVLLATAADFRCFAQLCNVLTAAIFPTLIWAIVSQSMWNYNLSNSDYVATHPELSKVVEIVSITVWADILIGVALYLATLGGFQVSYIWDSFCANLCHLNEGMHPAFWETVVKSLYYAGISSQIVLASVMFSVVAVYASLKLGDQSVVSNYTRNSFCG